MSHQADEQRRKVVEDNMDREDFFDCQETLEPPDRGDEDRQQAAEETRVKTDRLTDARHQQADAETGPIEDNETWEDSDSNLNVDAGCRGELDDDDLREAQELTEEEKESRRLDSFTLKEKGNRQFKTGDWLAAEHSYSEALLLCPVCFSQERAVLFSNRAAARLHLDLKDDGIADCSRALELNPHYMKALLRRAELYEQTEQLEKALEDYQKVLEEDPKQTGARQACMRLPQQIHERNEKLKEEMLDKLKDLGNLVLRPFGLSTNNFQVNQDANTGSYSINFVNKPNNT
ncbi:tetratricopeptide repeat protein 1 [Dunckerocampus dactyliophorus]|uniref:tetratricopeptide repeat protein 1 n=1 Tax=Dunckerocampus dactyliophorus TaxID=161453 RepID=UPI0024072D93|nr:tetratricopeptide repeat protein 1 [Dunckerocampus dactyliophorus]XP_054611999.1 tetratricopeptide repeat protein 1 [Dunckerocampus dactyliophorus]